MAILLRERPVLTGIVGNPPYGPTGKPGTDAIDSEIAGVSKTKFAQFNAGILRFGCPKRAKVELRRSSPRRK